MRVECAKELGWPVFLGLGYLQIEEEDNGEERESGFSDWFFRFDCC